MTLDGTNTWLIAEPGSATAVVVDPGPDDEGHLRRVHALAADADQQVSRILLTHGHRDHSAGARRLAELTGAPVLALDPAQRLGAEGLGSGDVVTAAGCEIRVIATPGHTAGSVSLLLPADRAVLTGDTVLGRGTTMISRDGSLGDYLASLDRLRALADSAALIAAGRRPSAIAGQRDRLRSRSGSISSTDLAASCSQPRAAKSASALLTVSRDAPTSWASSSWVRSWFTCSPSSCLVPNRSARSSRALATRPGTSVKTRSAMTSLARRSRWASAWSRCRATSGRPVG